MSSAIMYQPTTICLLDFASIAQILRHIFSSESYFPFLLEYPNTFISGPTRIPRAHNLVSMMLTLLNLLMVLFLGCIFSSSTFLWALINAPNAFISTAYANLRACDLAIHMTFWGLAYFVVSFLSISWFPRWLLRFLRESSLFFVKNKDLAAVVRKLWEADQTVAKPEIRGGIDRISQALESLASSPATNDDSAGERSGSRNYGQTGFQTEGSRDDRSQTKTKEQQRGNSRSVPRGKRHTSIYSQLSHYSGMFCQLGSESANPAQSMREHRAGRMGQGY